MMRILMSVVLFTLTLSFTPAYAEETSPTEANSPTLSSMLVPGAVYDGVWKTEGSENLFSRITLGQVREDGKLSIAYGIRPLGDGHNVTTTTGTITPEGFRFGSFDPNRGSIEFVFVVTDDGATLKGTRRAVDNNGRELLSTITMTRVSEVATQGG